MNAEMTAQLVTNALVMAIWRRGKPDALLHHSDRGSQYTSDQFQKLMADHGSPSRKVASISTGFSLSPEPQAIFSRTCVETAMPTLDKPLQVIGVAITTCCVLERS